MRVLLDTQVWLWMLAEPERLSDPASRLVQSRENELFLSAASAWEIAVKCEMGKLILPGPPSEVIPDLMRKSAVIGLPVQHSHALRVAELPPHHRDPFDRLLVAQAQLESLPLLTANRRLAAYDVTLIPATASA